MRRLHIGCSSAILLSQLLLSFYLIFIARPHVSADARYCYNNSVCPSVCPSRYGIVSKRLNVSSYFIQLYGNLVVLVFLLVSIFEKFRWGHPPLRRR